MVGASLCVSRLQHFHFVLRPDQCVCLTKDSGFPLRSANSRHRGNSLSWATLHAGACHIVTHLPHRTCDLATRLASRPSEVFSNSESFILATLHTGNRQPSVCHPKQKSTDASSEHLCASAEGKRRTPYPSWPILCTKARHDGSGHTPRQKRRQLLDTFSSPEVPVSGFEVATAGYIGHHCAQSLVVDTVASGRDPLHASCPALCGQCIITRVKHLVSAVAVVSAPAAVTLS